MTEYIIPKRTKGKRPADIGNPELYKFYLSQIKPVESISGGQTIGSYALKQKKYSNILKDLNVAIREAMILENFEFKMPYNLGKKSMVQKKVKYKLDPEGNLDTKNLSVDWKATVALWNTDEEARTAKTLIFHTNEHTDGNRMSWRWSKKGAACTGIAVYYFETCRDMKRAPSKHLKAEGQKLMFYEIKNK